MEFLAIDMTMYKTQGLNIVEVEKMRNAIIHELICKKCVVLPVNGFKNIAVEQCEVWGKERSGLVVHL